jgi:hypothetical protein
MNISATICTAIGRPSSGLAGASLALSMAVGPGSLAAALAGFLGPLMTFDHDR